jgi:hypothetical protein
MTLTYSCLCQDCLHVQFYPSEFDQLQAHDAKSFCEKCGKGEMCCCHGCIGWIESHHPELGPLSLTDPIPF